MSGVVAVVCAGLAAWLWLPAPPRPAASGGRRAVLLGGATVGSALVLMLVGRPRMLALALVATAVVGAVVVLVRRRRQDRRAERERARVVELCDVLAAELATGQPAPAALEHASADWPHLAPASRAAARGGDVPTALRELAGAPGAGDLRILAAAWQVAHRTGHGLADAVTRVATELRAAERSRRVVAGELASARATARLVAALPFFVLLMGAGAGGDPWSFLLGHPAGLACLAVGLGFEVAGWAWLEAIARGVEHGR